MAAQQGEAASQDRYAGLDINMHHDQHMSSTLTPRSNFGTCQVVRGFCCWLLAICLLHPRTDDMSRDTD